MEHLIDPKRSEPIQESNPENEPWVNVHEEQEQENTSSRDVRIPKKEKESKRSLRSEVAKKSSRDREK